MQSGTPTKAHSTLSVLAGLILVGMLSACGGGSGSAIDRAKQDNHAVIPPGENALNKYIGTYPLGQCFSVSYNLSSSVYLGMISQVVLSASDKPNTLNFSEIFTFYESDTNPRCAVEVGKATTYGELTYFGTLPSVEFFNSTKSPLPADKLEFTYTNLVTTGQVDMAFDELSDYRYGKSLFAQDGNAVYSGDDKGILDADGFPTKLDINSPLIRQ